MATDIIEPDARETITPIVGDYIVSTPGTCGGEPRIAGTRIKVRHVYNWVERQGMTPAKVVEQYPHLTMAGVHAALSYYWSHVEDIHRADAEEGQFVSEFEVANGPSIVAQKMNTQD